MRENKVLPLLHWPRIGSLDLTLSHVISLDRVLSHFTFHSISSDLI